jgi:peptide/nickel transport system substrate-binding protein
MGGAEKLAELYKQWRSAPDHEARARIWGEMLEIHATEMYSIGLIGGIPQPIVAHAKLRNVPVKGIYNWDPGAHFGLYRPDRFWWDDAAKRAEVPSHVQ